MAIKIDKRLRKAIARLILEIDKKRLATENNIYSRIRGDIPDTSIYVNSGIYDENGKLIDVDTFINKYYGVLEEKLKAMYEIVDERYEEKRATVYQMNYVRLLENLGAQQDYVEYIKNLPNLQFMMMYHTGDLREWQEIYEEAKELMVESAFSDDPKNISMSEAVQIVLDRRGIFNG